MDENKPRRRWLRFGIRDLLWAMALIGMGLGWWLDRSQLREKAYYLEWKAYQLWSVGRTAEDYVVLEDGNLEFEHANGVVVWTGFPRTAERRKEWDEFRTTMLEPSNR